MGPLTDLPPALVAGWALWVVGGVALLLWFRRRSARPPGFASPPPAASPRRSGTRPVAVRPQAAHAPDPFTELSTLLDPPDDSAR